ncbi:MAG: lysophospholipid acyltransferase family protein [Chthoniobacterales bacterium]
MAPKVYQFTLPRLVQSVCFWTGWTLIRAILLCCVRVRRVGKFPADLPGGFILATNHNSHLDAHILGGLIPRKVDWLSRVEFFQHPLWAFLLHAVSAIPIHRQGVPVRAIRTAIRTLKAGGNIGICPEGEVRDGADSVIHGGQLKKGVGLLSRRTGAPVVPCVILGVQALCRVEPWLPARRGEVWMNVGQPIYPRLDLPAKEAREVLCLELEAQFCELYRQICQCHPAAGK